VVEQTPGQLEGACGSTPASAQVYLTITGAVRGTVLNRIRDMVNEAVETSKPLLTPVEKRGLVLAVRWARGRLPYQLNRRSDLFSSSKWEGIGLPASGAIGETSANGAAEFA
jgi:hypothetical protein